MNDKGEFNEKLLALQAYECRCNLFYFLKTFWDVIIKEKPVFNWHIPFLCDELQMLGESIIRRDRKPYDLIVNIPPGSTKSTVATIVFPAWLWANDPTLRIISNSYSSELSEEHSAKTKYIITSARYRLLFPNVRIRRNSSGKSTYETTAGGERRPTSTGSAATGRHAHLILNDDPLDISKAESEPYRKQAIGKMKELSSRMVDKMNTPMVTIMQRLHENDVTGYLLNLEGETVRHICLPAELSNRVKPAELKANYTDGLLDCRRISRRVIERAKLVLGSRGYAGQYAQCPVAEGGNIIKESWFGKISLTHFLAVRGYAPIHFFIDTAYDEKKAGADNDPSGIIAACKIQGKVYIYHAQKVYMEFPELCRFAVSYVKSYGYTQQSTVRIEPKANGKSVIQALRRGTKLNITPTSTPTESKTVRLTSVSPKIECGRVVLVEGAWNGEFIDEVCGFPAKEHDEYVDILYYAIDYFLRNDETDVDGDLRRLAELEAITEL
jgi:predicted phage terminase large subunit-like protein